MRTVKRHAEVGYELPQHRDSCRHCKHLDLWYDDRPGFSGCAHSKCKHHGMDVMLGGVCPMFVWKNVPYKRAPRPGERDPNTADMFAR